MSRGDVAGRGERERGCRRHERNESVKLGASLRCSAVSRLLSAGLACLPCFRRLVNYSSDVFCAAATRAALSTYLCYWPTV